MRLTAAAAAGRWAAWPPRSGLRLRPHLDLDLDLDRRVPAGLVRVALLVLLMLLVGCAAPRRLPDHPTPVAGAPAGSATPARPSAASALTRAVSPAAASPDTVLGRLARDALPAPRPGEPPASGFQLLLDGEAAFALRLALLRQAQRSVDVQLYALADDATGRAFLQALAEAADRGVQVRLLLDDLHAPADAVLAGLAARPGVSVRLFNPLPWRGAPLGLRLLAGLRDAPRLNRRMHNKLLVVDGAFALAGGRNMADAYFMHDAEANFLDLDLLAAGPVVQTLSAVFASYWACDCAVPLPQRVPAADPAEARAGFEAAVRPADLGPGAAAPGSDGSRLPGGRHPEPSPVLAEGLLRLEPAPVRVLADAPAPKLRGLADEALGDTVAGQALALLTESRQEALVISPYLIPGAEGLAVLRRLAEGEPPVEVNLLTNSVGATDEPLAYAAYARYRIDLLRAGVRIHELSPTRARAAGRLLQAGEAVGRLHAKALVIDRQRLVVGSMNLDPRSTHTNTEIALVVDSPVLARQMAEVYERAARLGGHALRLAGDPPRIEWVADDGDGRRTVHRHEPHADVWHRLRLLLLRPWLSEDLL